MIKIIKKNQLTVLVLSLMLVTAGYLNYNSNIQTTSTEIADIGDATLVSSNLSNNVISENKIENAIIENQEIIASSVSTTEGNILKTNSEIENLEEYFSSSKLERDTMYSQMLESYQKILDSTTTTEKQKMQHNKK